MSITVIASNLVAMNTQRSLGINTKSKASSMEKLSSGYKINRAADDAAGLAISEKMRKMIRGLNQGTANAQDGISWVQIGDGSLDEAHSILHRMTELTVKSLNGTWADSDRAAMQSEFEELQAEINHITYQSKFNDKHIFARHESPSYQFQGNIEWLPNQKHIITEELNDLTITYKLPQNAAPQTASISVPVGEYTTRELMDEIDTALENAGLKEKGIMFEYTDSGTCNLNLEGGTAINEAVGGLSYLLYDVYKGGSTGALIGTTQFLSDTAKLRIRAGLNDNIAFDIVSLNGNNVHKDLTIPAGDYTRDDLINWLNNNLQDTSATAIKYGQGIKLTSDDSIITGFKGNMFKVDYPEKGEIISTSVFYDNIGYENVSMMPAKLTGGAVLTTDVTDIEHSYYFIDDSNNKLTVQPNGSATAATLEIPGGYYTAESMKDKLIELFAAHNLELDAEVYKDKDNYQGLVITSKVKGLDSDVGIDANSSAYNTLFVTRAYSKLEEAEKYVTDEHSDSNAYFLGGKTFYTDSWPLVIEAGKNDTFQLTVNGVSHNISLAEDTYNDMNELRDAISKAIKAAAATAAIQYPDNPEIAKALNTVTPTSNSSRIQLSSSDIDVTTITASAYTDANNKVNEGFADIFTTHVSYSSTTANSINGVATLNTQISLPATVSKNKELLNVYLDNKVYSVTIPAGTYNTYDKLLEIINDQLPKPEYKDVPITFTDVNQYGVNNTFQSSSTGQTVPPSNPIHYQAAGSSDLNQGQVGDSSNDTPAKVEIDLPYFPSSGGLQLTTANNAITIEINGAKNTIYLDTDKTFQNKSELAANLREKLDDWLGSGDNGVDVVPSSSGLILTTRQKGDGTNISCGTDTSSFLYSMNTQITTASITIPKQMNSSITITAGSNDTFKFTYNGNIVNLTLSQGTYTQTTLRNEINSQLNAKGIAVEAVMNNSSFLTLRATTPGAGHKLEIDSTDCGSALKAIFNGADSQQQPAVATLDKEIQEPITIDPGTNQFKIYINNSWQTVTLTTGTYTSRDDFVSELNSKLTGVTVELDSNKLKFTTTNAVGANARIYMQYSNGGNSMKAIFGEESQLFRGVKAEFSSDHKLQLTALDQNNNTDPQGSITVYSSSGSIFQTSVKSTPQTYNGSAHTGYHSKIYSCIDGASLNGSPVKITQWNNSLSFSYRYDSYYSTTVNIALDPGEYTYAELEEALQKKLDASVGTGAAKLTAQVSSDGVNILAGYPGNRYYLVENSFSGGFYYNILRHTPEQKYNTTVAERKGGNDGNIYAVGRKDIRNGYTVIEKEVNDTLSLDLTYGDNVEKISITLSPGSYDGSSLINQIQSKLNEQLVQKGFEPNTILANIGGINTGVTGNNDHNALVFSLNNHVKLPVMDVEYRIDGIGGTAAFSVFYQTDGDIKIAYVTGTKDISNGVTIPKDSSLSFDTDGEHYSITIPAGKYSTGGIIEELNKQLKNANAPVLAKLEGKNLKLSHTKYGEHYITNISGDAKRYLFFQENSFYDAEQNIKIMPSDRVGDQILIDRPTVTTASLGIHSVIITKPKYAEKALTRIGNAVDMVSKIRSSFGATQNRLEHTINSNNNTAENLQASESIIRDTDISREILEMSRSNILEQVGNSILAQANQTRQDLVRLLQ